jgi:protein O-mannosyl-transferase
MKGQRRSRKVAPIAPQVKDRPSVASVTVSSPRAAGPSLRFSKPVAGAVLALIAINVIVYGAVAHHDFVAWDDGDYVSSNPNVTHGLTWQSVQWAFTTGWAANWHPLTWLSHMLDVQLYGVNAGPHLVTNLLLHIANTLLLFGFLYWMTGALGRSAFVAGLFATHPLHVESVAWVSERKDVLSTLFWMLTLWAYMAYLHEPRRSRYGTVVILFALGLMAKPMLVTLPFVLLLLDYWPFNRFSLGNWPEIWPLVREKLPLIVIAAASSVVTYFVQKQGGAVRALEALPVSLRLENAAVSYIAYIIKMLWPVRLATFYPMNRSLPAWEVLGSLVVLAAITLFVIKAARDRRYLIVGWLWYLGTLVPVIGLVQVGGQSMADRYTYVPYIGLFIMAAWGLTEAVAGWRYGRVALPATALAAVVVCMVVAHAQVRHWENSIALWTHAIDVTSDNYRAHSNLANILSDQGKLDEALQHYSAALKANSNFVEGRTNMANALARQGKVDEAVKEYSEALRVRPDYAGAHNGLAAILSDRGKIDEAITHYREAIRLDPQFAEAHNNLAAAFAQQGHVDDAIQEMNAALKIQPDSQQFHANLDMLLKAKSTASQNSKSGAVAR